MKTNVDILSMSATPIPRTLEMAVAGIREMSTLATAPEERHPVLSYVGENTDEQVTAAIRRELLREGLSERQDLRVSVATTASTVVACGRNGAPLRPALLWMDCRAAAEAERGAPASRLTRAESPDTLP